MLAFVLQRVSAIVALIISINSLILLGSEGQHSLSSPGFWREFSCGSPRSSRRVLYELARGACFHRLRTELSDFRNLRISFFL